MFKLRKIHPPYGTDVTPVWEPAYSEHVKVVNGLCEVREPATRNYLLNLGYELMDETPSEQAVVSHPPNRKPDKAPPRRGKS